jgi:HlyD family secretion protein
MKAKRSAARRRAREQRSPTAAPDCWSARLTWDEVQTALDEELLKLPEAFRTAFVLCVLEGKSGPEAAAALGCKKGTVSSRLTRARQQLQRQLTRRGINLGALLGTLTIAEGANPAVASTLTHMTVRHALAAGHRRSTGPPALRVADDRKRCRPGRH